MQGVNRRLVNPPVSSHEAFAELDRAKQDTPSHVASALVDEGAIGLFRNTGSRPATFLADRNVVIELEPAAAASSVILWTWTKDSTSCCFVSLDNAEAFANDLLKQINVQRNRSDG